MLRLQSINLSSLKKIRVSYLKEIKLSQDMYSETHIRYGSSSFLLFEDNKEIGYCILTSDNELIEFYLINDVVQRKEELFKYITSTLDISTVYCKSYDHILLSCCHSLAKSSSLIGFLFQDYNPEVYAKPDETTSIRIAKEEDLPFLLSLDNDLFESEEELHNTVINDKVFLFEKGNELIGCGYLFRIISEMNNYDLGVWVNASFREQGYATLIISYLKDYCLTNGFIPTCGCAADNIASRKTLQKSGFTTKYCLIEFCI